MKLSAEELGLNFDKLIAVVEQHIASPRREQLLELYRDHAERILFMPASGTEHYHNCWPGGYVDHVLRVIDGALKIKHLWESFGATVNYTDEELVFAALNHDLGKIGTEEAEQYIVNDSEWHRKNQGKMYKNNPINSFMTVPDRSLKLLADRGIKVSENEWYGIKLHDGLYDDGNKHYYISYDPASRLRTNLPYVLHQADQMAARVEYEMWSRKQDEKAAVVGKRRQEPTIPDSVSEQQKQELINVFDSLFKQ
jgi:hypothetical protein